MFVCKVLLVVLVALGLFCAGKASVFSVPFSAHIVIYMQAGPDA